MVHDLTGETRKFSDLDALSVAAAEDIVGLIERAVRSKGIFHLALSGGNTPRTLYHLLGSTYAKSIPWESVHVFFCDERFVPHGDPSSNFRMVKETLLDFVSIPEKNLHPIPTTQLEMKVASRNYEVELRKTFGSEGESFDLAIMGIGREGHTASLFPGSPALEEREKWVLGLQVDAVPSQRITLTFPILNRARAVYFLVSGAEKAGIMKRLSKGENDFHLCPAAGIRLVSGQLIWWVDRAALPD
jgi:6-phosphogluconolactonase